MLILRRALFLALAVEVPLVLLLEAWGIPSPFHHDTLGEVITATHAPGIALLETLNLCCGFANSLVISDVWVGPVQRPSLVGFVLLFGANALMLAAFVYLALLLRRVVARKSADAAA
jgi:hypothetical protein